MDGYGCFGGCSEEFCGSDGSGDPDGSFDSDDEYADGGVSGPNFSRGEFLNNSKEAMSWISKSPRLSTPWKTYG